MTKYEADLVYDEMRVLLKKAVDGSRLGASQEYMQAWLSELDSLMSYTIHEAIRAGEPIKSAIGDHVRH